MQADIDRILIERHRIAARVEEMGDEIARIYRDAEPSLMIVCVLSGAIIFVADLIRQLPIKMNIGLVTVSSYPGRTTASQGATLLEPMDVDVAGRHVLIVDDILDSGNTLRAVQAELTGQGPASLRTCVLLRKADKAPDDVRVDVVGFDIDDVFVVGYGLDYGGHYRNYPHIAVLKPHLYG